MKLNDKVVVVTGSGNGIGEAFARRFVHEGAKVVVTDIEADAVERVTSEIGAVGLAVDITVEENVQAVADLARRTYGEVDVWFSNAGYSGPPEPGKLAVERRLGPHVAPARDGARVRGASGAAGDGGRAARAICCRPRRRWRCRRSPTRSRTR